MTKRLKSLAKPLFLKLKGKNILQAEKSISTESEGPSIKITLNKRNLLLIFSPILLSIVIVLGYRYKSSVIVATVNGKPITRVALWKTLEQQAGARTLDTLVTQELILQEGKNQNVSITPQDIETEIQNIETSVSSQGLTLEQALESQGMSRNQLEQQLKVQITLEKLVSKDTQVTEDEVSEALATLLDSGQEDSPELRAQLKQQLEQTKSSQAMQAYLSDLRQKSEINVLNNKFDMPSEK